MLVNPLIDSTVAPGGEVRALLAGLSIGVVQLDVGCRIVDLNGAAEEILGARRSTLIGRALDDVYRLMAGEGRGRLRSLADRALRETVPTERSEIRLLLRPDGVSLPVCERAMPIGGPGGVVDGAWLLVEDVTELHALRREHQYLTFHDPVTGLLNRRAFEGHLDNAVKSLAAGTTHAFGYIDLDDFEAISDTFGQVAGDEMLRQLIASVSQALGDRDVLARLSEVRFAILLDGCRPGEIESIAQRLRQAIADFRFVWQHETFEIGATIGLVPIDATTVDLQRLLAAADAATTMARDETQAVHRFDPQSSRDIKLADHFGDMRWLSRIHRALKKGGFRLYRQPIVPTDDPSPENAPLYEVLLRMVDRDGEIVTPGAFIQAAERFRLISSIDRWVVRAVLDQMTKEPDATYAVAVNLSGRSVGEASFLDDVSSYLDEHPEVRPQRLCFEITETAAVSNLQRARRFISVLKARGCRFVLDDFGSGLSSFAYLKNLDVDFIKIDGSFVVGMADDPVHRAIITAIHQVGASLELATIAEYVETETALEELAALGVDYAQGFWIRRPQPWSDA
ncbi:MAG: EAL domain-containing protein [Acidobacteriota bacterium]